jgi:hypothetical protein
LTVLPSAQLYRTEGVSSIDLCGSPLSKRDLEKLTGTFSVLLGLPIIVGRDDEPINGETAKVMLIWKILLADGWSSQRLSMTLAKFKRTFEPYGNTWTPKKFLDCSPENDLHDNVWYLDLSESDRARCEIFRAPDNKCLYRYQGTGVGLPKEFMRVWPELL